MSALEAEFEFQLKAMKIAYKKEQSLVPGRRYRWDFIVGDLAIEINGGSWIKSGHSTGTGLQRDYDKAYEALKAGYRPLSLTGKDVKSGEGIQKVIQLMKVKSE